MSPTPLKTEPVLNVTIKRASLTVCIIIPLKAPNIKLIQRE